MKTKYILTFCIFALLIITTMSFGKTIKSTIFGMLGYGTVKTGTTPPISPIYDLSFKTLDGKTVNFNDYKGKKLLIVNTASECGFTYQYEGLEALNKQYGSKITILGFPANNFGGQEPGKNEDIGAFCQKNYGVDFQMFEKSDVVGANANPIHEWLTNPAKNGWNSQAPKWNFCKYLINEKGELVKFLGSSVEPMDKQIIEFTNN